MRIVDLPRAIYRSTPGRTMMGAVVGLLSLHSALSFIWWDSSWWRGVPEWDYPSRALLLVVFCGAAIIGALAAILTIPQGGFVNELIRSRNDL